MIALLLALLLQTTDCNVVVRWETYTHPQLQSFRVLVGTQPGEYDREVEVNYGSLATTVDGLECTAVHYVCVEAVGTFQISDNCPGDEQIGIPIQPMPAPVFEVLFHEWWEK